MTKITTATAKIDGLDDREIALQDAVDQQLADAGKPENNLDHTTAAGKLCGEIAGDGHGGQEGIAQRMHEGDAGRRARPWPARCGRRCAFSASIIEPRTICTSVPNGRAKRQATGRTQ